MTLLAQSAFLHELVRMYQTSTETGSVVITTKRVTDAAAETSKVLMRAKTGSKHISVHVEAAELPEFQVSLSSVLKMNMTALRKRPKKAKA